MQTAAVATAPGSRAGPELAGLLMYVLERAWLLAQRERTSTRQDLGAGVDAIAERLADLEGLDEIGRTPDEAASDAAAEAALTALDGQAEAGEPADLDTAAEDEPTAEEVAALLAEVSGLQEEG